MAQYINKFDLVSIIDNHLSYYKDLEDRSILSKEGEAAYRVVKILKSDINSLEVKEVDLEKEIDDYVNVHFSECDDGVLLSDANSMELTLLDIMPLAKHFYSLGIKAQKGEKV